MSHSLEPVVVVDAPQAIVNLAVKDSRIVINRRPDQWPSDVRERFKNDKSWQEIVGPYDGALVSPELTDFIRRIQPGAKLAMLFQDTDGVIFVQVGTFLAVRTKSKIGLWYGMNLGVILEERRHLHPKHGGVTWSSSILAIAQLPVATRPAMRFDPDGSLFLSKLMQ
ncbi:MAG: hypothetical protein NUW00_00340 [Candidatus Kaiserbacteria bacterium]|nr:hypothetical protein [Candidatus Kaiserbacteria bacterium]